MQVREVPPEEGEVVNGGKPGPPPADEEVARKSNLVCQCCERGGRGSVSE